PLIYGQMRKNLALDEPTSNPRNDQLARLLAQLHGCQEGLAIILRRLAEKQQRQSAWSLGGGLYLAGSGAEPGDCAFLPGILEKLHETQDIVSWTREALGEDAACHFWGRCINVIVAAVFIVFFCLLVVLLR